MPEELKFGFNPNYTSDVSHGNGLVQWLVNGNPMAVDLDRPTLQSVMDGNTSYGSNRHVFEVDEGSKVSLRAYADASPILTVFPVAILGYPTRDDCHYASATPPRSSSWP
jgi:hypothetical protein